MFTNSKLRKPLLFIILITFFNCKGEDEVAPGDRNSPTYNMTYLKSLMEQWYLWNDELPDINIENYENQDGMLVSLRNEKDKWSHIQSKEDYDAYYNSGQVTNGDEGVHGIYLYYMTESDLYIRFSYPGSKANNAGLIRGAKVHSINGLVVSNANSEEINTSLGENKKGVSNTFEITVPAITKYVNGVEIVASEARDTTITIEKEELIVNPILLSEVIEMSNGKKVGHIVFKSFIVTAEEALSNAFADFKSKGVSEVVLDLRYNGGGRVNIAQQIAGYLAPTAAAGKELFKYQHNGTQSSEYNESQNLEILASNLNLEKVYIIADGGTASSSELVINCLKPYMDVQLIGQQTYGKPVGSYGFENNDFIYSIISLRILNADGIGNYFDGLEVDQMVADDVRFNWGDVREPMLYQALYNIENGTYDNSAANARMSSVNLEYKNKAFKTSEPKEKLFNDILMLKKI